MKIVESQSNRGLPLVNVTSAVNFSTAALDYISAEQNQFILIRTDTDIMLIPVLDTINFADNNNRYKLNDVDITASMCILRKVKAGSTSKSGRITSAYAMKIPANKYKINRISLSTPLVLKHKNENLNINVSTVYKLTSLDLNLSAELIG